MKLNLLKRSVKIGAKISNCRHIKTAPVMVSESVFSCLPCCCFPGQLVGLFHPLPAGTLTPVRKDQSLSCSSWAPDWYLNWGKSSVFAGSLHHKGSINDYLMFTFWKTHLDVWNNTHLCAEPSLLLTSGCNGTSRVCAWAACRSLLTCWTLDCLF